MKRNDIILIITVLVVALGAVAYMIITKTQGDQVIVSIDGKVVDTFNLREDITYKIQGEDGKFNLLVIQDGVAHIEDASCPDKICINQGDIQNNGETIVCLPNKVVIEIQSSTESDIDSLVK